jgi:predicted alpha-1,2-mannosidase
MPNKFLFTIFAITIFYSTYSQPQSKSYTQYVDPHIGSAGHGHVFVGANVPFGAIQLGPNNIFEGWDWCSGYNYSSNTIVGFAHTHLSGTGISDLNDVLVMPATGKIITTPGEKANTDNGYVSTFSHANEIAKPGYYSVVLDRYKIKAELTATERVGFHKYSFPANAVTPHIILNLEEHFGWDKPTETYIKQINSTTLVGYRFSTGWAVDQRLFFAIKLSQPLSSLSLFDSTVVFASTEAKGVKLEASLNFNRIEKNVLQMKIGISPVSYENALLNLNTELPDWDFGATVKKANEKWNKALSKVAVQANDNTMKVFYTALYHSFFAPSLFNDVNGDYSGTDKKIYPKANFTNYTTFSLWDTYRAFHPMSTILLPEKVNDFIKTMLAIYKQQGKLPVWPLVGNETDCMVGYSAIPVIVDAYLKGFRDYDVTLAYEAIKQSAMQKTDGIDYIQKLEYIPADKVTESVAKALEYAISDWSIAQMAKAIGKSDDYNYYSKRAKLYEEYFDSTVGFMRGRLSDGSWRTPFSPFTAKHRDDDYTEGNAWQYTWLAPQDVEGLIALFGSEKKFATKLDSLFSLPANLGAESSPDISGLIGNYAQGNEPNHHIPYLFVYAGQQWKTAAWIRKIFEQFYTSKPDGLCGNEDVGQMSAWYILSAMGIYQVNPANGAYVFGSPAVNSATIALQGGKKFTIKAAHNSKDNIYIQKVTRNGKPYTQAFITYKDIAKGGILTFYMGNKISTFGIKKEDRPVSNKVY